MHNRYLAYNRYLLVFLKIKQKRNTLTINEGSKKCVVQLFVFVVIVLSLLLFFVVLSLLAHFVSVFCHFLAVFQMFVVILCHIFG